MQIRQKIIIKTKGQKDFYIHKTLGSIKNLKGQECKCILCNRNFKAIRNNIKICASEHLADVIDIYSGEIYEKLLQKWNVIYKNNENFYLEGKCYSSKRNQVSTNNIVTILKGTNNICNLTYEDRSAISQRQKENGTFAFWNYSYEERSKRSKALAKERINNGTHNWLWGNKTEEAKRLTIENSVKVKLEKIEEVIKNLKNITFNRKPINYESFNLYESIPGVWALFGINKETKIKECLTIGQTINLNKELKWTLRVLANRKLTSLEKENPGCTGRWDKIQKNYCNYEYQIICANEKDKNKIEIIEAIEAINNKAIFWLPSITQQSNDFKEKLINWIHS